MFDAIKDGFIWTLNVPNFSILDLLFNVYTLYSTFERDKEREREKQKETWSWEVKLWLTGTMDRRRMVTDVLKLSYSDV